MHSVELEAKALQKAGCEQLSRVCVLILFRLLQRLPSHMHNYTY